MPADADNGIYLRKCEADYRCQLRPGHVFATVRLGEPQRACCRWVMNHTTHVSDVSGGLAGAVTSAGRTDPISLRRLRLPCLELSRPVRFTNRFTKQAIDLRFPAPFPSSWRLSSHVGSRAGPESLNHHRSVHCNHVTNSLLEGGMPGRVQQARTRRRV
jgi:hypothetical protein